METDSLSCLGSVGGSVRFTFPYVLFKIYLLNLDTIEFWQRLRLNLGKKNGRYFALFFFFCLHVGVLFFYSKPIQLCRRLQRAYRSDCM